MRDTLEAFLGRAALQRLPFLDARAVAAARDRHLSGRAQLGFELWGLMALSAWWNSITDSSRRSAGSAPPRPLVLKELAC